MCIDFRKNTVSVLLHTRWTFPGWRLPHLAYQTHTWSRRLRGFSSRPFKATQQRNTVLQWCTSGQTSWLSWINRKALLCNFFDDLLQFEPEGEYHLLQRITRRVAFNFAQIGLDDVELPWTNEIVRPFFSEMNNAKYHCLSRNWEIVIWQSAVVTDIAPCWRIWVSWRVVWGAKESQSGKGPRFVSVEFNLQFQLIFAGRRGKYAGELQTRWSHSRISLNSRLVLIL